MNSSDITRTPQPHGAMSPAAAIAAAFAAAAAHQQQDAAVTPNYQAASTTPWGAQIARPRNFQGHAVAVTQTWAAPHANPLRVGGAFKPGLSGAAVLNASGALSQPSGVMSQPSGVMSQPSGPTLAGGVPVASGAPAASSVPAAPAPVGLNVTGVTTSATSAAVSWDGAPQIELTAHGPTGAEGPGVDLIIDEEAQRQDESLRQRKEALVSNVIALQQGALTSFSLVEEGMTMVKVEPSTILEEEQDFVVGESEEDFIAGNVTELQSTGTDNGSAISTAVGLPSDGSIAGTVSDVEVEDVPIIPARLHVSSTLNLPNAGADRSPGAHLLPSLLSDFVHCWYAYGAAILLCIMCLLNVYQVQATNTVNARLNEVSLSNESIEREWLNLMAQRQNLSEHTTVRDSAIYQLQMVAPQTEKEHVIYLKHKQ